MDRGGAGISWKYTTSGNDYKQPDVHASASGSGQYRHGTVRKVNVPPSCIQKRNECHPASDACTANHPSGHSIKPVHGFNALITPEKMDWLVRRSARYGDHYDGKTHSQFACSIKQYTSRAKRPLNHSEQRQLIPLLHDFKVTPQWSWRSLTTTLHSLTSADVLTPHKYMNKGDRETQAALLSNLLDAVIHKCNQKPEASDIDIQGIANLLWALVKLVDNGLELKKAPKLIEAVAALLPHVQTKAESKEEKDYFLPQHITNLLRALAKLVGNGLKLEKTPKLKETVTALLPHVKTKAESKEEKDHFKRQEVVTLLWALAKLVDNGLKLDKMPKLKEAVAALLPHVKTKAKSKEEQDHFKPQEVANLLWAVVKLVDNGLKLEKTPKLKETVAALLPHVKSKAESIEEKDCFKPQEVANLLWAVAKLVENGLKPEKTPKLKEVVAALLYQVTTKAKSKEETDHFKPQEVANLLWAVAKLVDNGLELEKTADSKEAVTALLSHVKTKAESKEKKDQFKLQEATNLLWAVAKLVDNGLEKTQKCKEAVTALLSHLKTKAESKEEKDHFKPQEVANLLWAVAKLVDNGLELEKKPKLKEAAAVLLPQVKTKAESKEEKDHFIPQHITNLLWALATLVDKGLEKTPELKEAVVVLLCHVKTKAESQEEIDHFQPQGVTNLLWAVAKLVDNGLELKKTAKLTEAVAALLTQVKIKAESIAEKDHLMPQHIANLLWAMAKLVDNGLELKKTAKFKEALAALLPQVKIKAESKEAKDHFKSQGVVNLLWALAKLVDNGLGLNNRPKLNEVVAALLPHVKTKAESKDEKDHFNTQGTANLLWALATLADSGLVLEKTAKLKEAVPALLHHVKTKAESKEERDDFNTQGTINLLWALAKLGEAIELNLVQSTFDFLVDRISKNPQLTQQDISMSLWGVMAFCARFYLDSGSNDKHSLEKHIGELFFRLGNTSPGNMQVQSVMAMAASWLGRACPVAPHYQPVISELQATFRDQLQSSLPLLKIEEEKSLNTLPPVDLLLPDYNMVIDVQGPFHYVSGDFTTRNGSTLLKIALLQKLGFEVIEIPVNKIDNQDSIKTVIEQIKAKLAVLPKAHGSVSLNSGEWVADEAYFTADDGGQFSDDCYFTAEEYLEEQTQKPKKRKRKRKKTVKTAAC
ncbi:DUF1601 domain-containing protein [Endozoicomonas acroporae]|uniref:RAP domain-containing protein n=1 Tax=Endozoicomonas acroporae TaxID=1701104 RepID=UPI003D7C0268